MNDKVCTLCGRNHSASNCPHTRGITSTSACSYLEEARLHVSYDMETGKFTRIRNSSNQKCGSEAGTVNVDGYLYASIAKKRVLLHRLAWLFVYGEWPIYFIDHINGDKTDNRISNLRDVTKEINGQNKRRHQANKLSALPLGVSAPKKYADKPKKYIAQIAGKGWTKHLGYFATVEEASAAYVEAKRKLHPGGQL